jgi:hypothetical protein
MKIPNCRSRCQPRNNCQAAANAIMTSFLSRHTSPEFCVSRVLHHVQSAILFVEAEEPMGKKTRVELKDIVQNRRLCCGIVAAICIFMALVTGLFIARDKIPWVHRFEMTCMILPWLQWKKTRSASPQALLANEWIWDDPNLYSYSDERQWQRFVVSLRPLARL